MNRHYYISDNLDELERVEQELEAQGISTEQIHVLSEQDAEVEHHHLHDVPSFMKQDVVHSGEIGALVGLVLAAAVLLAAYWLGWTASAAGLRLRLAKKSIARMASRYGATWSSWGFSE